VQRCALSPSFVFVLARDSLYATRSIYYRPSVCLSVRLSHGWISQRRLKLGSPIMQPSPRLYYENETHQKNVIKRKNKLHESARSGIWKRMA